LPANYEESFKRAIPVTTDWGKIGFDAEWHVWLVEPKPPYEIISHDDSTEWSYVPVAMSHGELVPANITREIKKTIEVVEFPS